MSDVDVAANLAAVKTGIADAAGNAARAAGDITLVAVSKTHDAARIRPALEAGHRTYGENRVQEARGKWPALKAACPDLELHLIGPLQTNKAEDAVALFDAIESVDRPRLVRALARAMEKTGRRPACFIQVNTGEEAQKAGCLPAGADALVAEARGAGLDVRGLMCIPPFDDEPSLHFALLADIARRNGLAGLSMGMSGDYETAVIFGATHVRVGTAIFGARPQPPA
ncbi:MAG: YggS family pyridoxal phosphate-dependent enzyme [Rhodospirillales bacterium]|nr:YggS family pyridoxal phosphate-dependent enzyme [Rhodospirillales bacterium]